MRAAPKGVLHRELSPGTSYVGGARWRAHASTSQWFEAASRQRSGWRCKARARRGRAVARGLARGAGHTLRPAKQQRRKAKGGPARRTRGRTDSRPGVPHARDIPEWCTWMRPAFKAADSDSSAPVWRLREKWGKKKNEPQTTRRSRWPLRNVFPVIQVLERQGVDAAGPKKLAVLSAFAVARAEDLEPGSSS